MFGEQIACNAKMASFLTVTMGDVKEKNFHSLKKLNLEVRLAIKKLKNYFTLLQKRL